MDQFNGLPLSFVTMELTLGSGDMNTGVVSALPGHHILEKLGQISSRVPLEVVVESDSVVKLS